VLWNLVRNAVEASPAGTTIAIAARPAEGDEAAVEIAVRDRGPGFSTEQRARLFEPFFSTKQGGTGLGLATVHRIIEAHHGKIRIESPDGGGAELVIRLPRRAAPVEALAMMSMS
jgi:signal transduction histidine kinase